MTSPWWVRALWWSFAAIVGIVSVTTTGLASTDAIASYATTIDREVSTVGLTRVVIDAELVAVEFTRSPDETLRLDTSIRAGLKAPNLSVDVRGDEVVVSLRSAHRIGFDAFYAGVMRVAVPKGLALDIRTDLGDVTGTGIDGGNISVQAELGDVRIGWRRPPDHVVVRTSSGRVRLELPDVEGGYAVITTTDTGAVTNSVGSESTSARTVAVTTEMGDITLASS